MSTASLADRLWAKVDKGPDCWIFMGTTSRGYGYIYDNRLKRGVVAHRAAYEIEVSTIPEGMVVDHICHNRTCVNPDHLRLATPKQNSENLSPKARKNNTSGYRGVLYNKKTRKWNASVTHQRRKINLCSFDTAEEAAVAARDLRVKLFEYNDADRVGSGDEHR